MKKITPIKPEVKAGDKKEVIKFAFFPMWLETPKEKIFLFWEKYIQCYEAEKVLEPVADAIGPYGCWMAWHNEWVIKWTKKGIKLIWKQNG